MDISAIVVHVDASSYAATRVAHAVALASSFQATLIGLLPQCGPSPGATFFTDCESSRKAFEVATANTSIAVDWRVGEGSPVEAMQCEGRLADLIVLSQPANDDPRHLPETRQFVEATILGAGPPVLVVPLSVAAPQRGWPYARVVVAWSGTRESARALRDALPILSRAQHVALICCIPWTLGAVPASYALTWLARRGIRAGRIDLAGATNLSAGRALVATAAAAHADLLVCGAQARQCTPDGLAAVAATVLDESPIPTLFAR